MDKSSEATPSRSATAAASARRSVEGRENAIAGGLHHPAPKPFDLPLSQPVVPIQEPRPLLVAELSRPLS
jgi:hypothetical protein